MLQLRKPIAALLAVFLLVVPATPAIAAQPDAAALSAAEAKATEAKAFFKAGLFPRAAERFMEAYALSKRPALVYNAARAYEEGGLRAEAIALFKLYEGLADASTEGKKEARERRERLEGEAQGTGTGGSGVNKPDEAGGAAQVKPTAAPAWQRPVMIGALSLGAAAALGGGILLGLASSEQSALDADLGRKGSDGKIVGLDYATYVERQTAVDDRQRLGVIGLSAGVALLAGGALLWAFGGEPPADSVAWSPAAVGPGRLEVTWRF